MLRYQDEMEKEQDRQEHVMNKVILMIAKLYKMRQEEYRKSLETQIKYQQNQYIGMVGFHKDQDQELVKSQWKIDQDRIKREAGEWL